MRLSDAIRKGHEILPFSAWFRLFNFDYGRISGACAMGKAIIGIVGLEGANQTNMSEIIPEAVERLPIRTFCPKCIATDFFTFAIFVTHLNDMHMLPALEIADIVEKVEDELY